MNKKNEEADEIGKIFKSMLEMKEKNKVSKHSDSDEAKALFDNLECPLKKLTDLLNLELKENSDVYSLEYNNYHLDICRDKAYILFECYPSNFNDYDDFIHFLNENSELSSILYYLKVIHLVDKRSDMDFQNEIERYFENIGQGPLLVDVSDDNQVKRLDEKSVNRLYSLVKIVSEPIVFLLQNGIKKYSDGYFLLNNIKSFNSPNITVL